MKRILLFILLFSFATSLSAQEDNADYSIDGEQYFSYEEESRPFRLLDTPLIQLGIYAASTPFFKQQSFGFGMDGQLWITNNFATGISFMVTGRRITPDFGYTIGDARMTFADISWLNELTVLNDNNLEVGARVSMGWAGYMLADNSIKERYWVWTEYGGYEAERALPVADNNFFKLAPGIALRYRIDKDVLLEANGAYNFYFGNTTFGNRVTFNNYILQLGIKINIHDN